MQTLGQINKEYEESTDEAWATYVNDCAAALANYKKVQMPQLAKRNRRIKAQQDAQSRKTLE